MSDPFPSDPNSTNGSKASRASSNGHNQEAKLPKDSLPQPLPSANLPRQTQRDIRKAFYTLLAVGLILGALTAGSVVWVMNRLDLIGVPDQPDQRL